MSDMKERGIYGKFEVRRTDGQSAVGEKHDGCAYFVLDLNHDPYAVPAIRAYAGSCAADYPWLAMDLRYAADRIEASRASPGHQVEDGVGFNTGTWEGSTETEEPKE